MGITGEHVKRSQDIINLAYEGVPQRAIARALQLPANVVKSSPMQWPAALSLSRPNPSGRKGRARPGIQPLPDP